MDHAKDRTLSRARIGLQSALAKLQNVKAYLKKCAASPAPAVPNRDSDGAAAIDPPPDCIARIHFVHNQQIVECPQCPR